MTALRSLRSRSISARRSSPLRLAVGAFIQAPRLCPLAREAAPARFPCRSDRPPDKDFGGDCESSVAQPPAGPALHDLPPPFEVDQVGEHRAAGGLEQALVEADVEAADDLGDAPLPRLELAQDLPLAQAPVADQAGD